MAPPPISALGVLQNVADRCRDGAPTSLGFLQLLAAGRRYFVDSRAAFVLRDHPFRGNPPGFFQTVKRRIERSFFDTQHLLRYFFDSRRDAISVQRTAAG